MKFLNYLLITAIACISFNSFAYYSGSADPARGDADKEYRAVVKSETSGYSDAVSVGHILTLDTDNTVDGATVTRVGENSVIGAARIACVATNAIATGETGSVQCQSRGYFDSLRYDASTAIAVGSKLCANAEGIAVVCAACDSVGSTNDCQYGTATQNSGIVSLEAKSSGTGSDLKVMVDLR